MRSLLKTPDGQSGLFFIVLGVGAGLLAARYPMGTLARMGPGFFPVSLSVILVGLGIVVAIGAIRSDEEAIKKLDLRALFFISSALVLSGIVLAWAGLVPAIVVLSVVGSLAARGSRLGMVTALTAGIIAAAYLVFVYGLGLRIPLLAL